MFTLQAEAVGVGKLDSYTQIVELRLQVAAFGVRKLSLFPDHKFRICLEIV